MAKIVLQDDYYLNNIKTLLDFVAQRYHFLLSEQEQSFYRLFLGLSEDAQRLYTRCLMRKGESFRFDKFNYPDIQDITQAKLELITACLLQEQDLNFSLPEVVKLFTKAELLAAFPAKNWRSLSRIELERKILSNDDASSFGEMAPQLQKQVSIVKVDKTYFDIFRLLFFGNLRQDLTEFVLQDLGLVEYTKYEISQTHLPIQSREEIKVLVDLHKLSDELHDLIEPNIEQLKRLASLLPPNPDMSGLIRRRHDRVANRIARKLERLGVFDKAAELYQLSQQTPARERFIRCLDYQALHSQAWEALKELSESNPTNQERQFINVFEKKIARKLGIEFSHKEISIKAEEKVVLEKTDTPVELAVARYVMRQDKVVFWVENSLFSTLFSVFYWDLIFADVEGAFHHPFQTAPNDLYEKTFLLKRADLYRKINSKFETNEQFREHMLKNIGLHNGLACRLSYWPVLSSSLSQYYEQETLATEICSANTELSIARFVAKNFTTSLLELALSKIPKEHFKVFFDFIWQDIGEHRSGMPDLIVFSEQGYELIEVKGPGDRLQSNQKSWMSMFSQYNIPHRIIRVEYCE